MFRNIYPCIFYLDQALDSLMLLPTNRSFRTGALLLSKRVPSKPVKHMVYALLEIDIEMSTVLFHFFSFTSLFKKKSWKSYLLSIILRLK